MAKPIALAFKGAQSNFHPPLVPLVVAVTGHRDLHADDLPALAAAVSAQLRRLSARHPNSPCLLLSALAEGADRLVARCAVDAGWSLGVVLPLAQADYEADFRDGQSVAEFRQLLASAAWCRDLSAPAVGRPACYSVLGDWLAGQSQVLIALWDGGPGNGPGGTADVVRRFREGAAIMTQPVLPDTGPVIHVHTRRIGAAPAASGSASAVASAAELGNVDYLAPRPAGMPGDGEQVRWTAVLDRIDQFNRHLRQANASGRLTVDAEGAASLPAPEGLVLTTKTSVAGRARALFGAADAMSMQAQRERSLMFKALLALGAATLVLAQTYAGLFTLPGLLCGALGLSAIGIVWYRVAARRHVEQRYLDYRGLAEACKVQYFWRLAGVADNVADHYLREQHDELEWIRQAVKTTALGMTSAIDLPLAQRLQWVRDAWIDDQHRYFCGDGGQWAGKAAQNRRQHETWSRRSRGLAAAGALLTIAAALFHLFVADLTISSHDWTLRGLMVGYSLVFGAAGLCKVYQQTSAFSEHARQYQRMGLALQIARAQLDAALAAGQLDQAAAVIKAAGIEALAENGDWLLLHRDRPVSAQGFG